MLTKNKCDYITRRGVYLDLDKYPYQEICYGIVNLGKEEYSIYSLRTIYKKISDKLNIIITEAKNNIK